MCILSEGSLRGGVCRIGTARIVDAPAHAGISFFQLRAQALACWRMNLFHQEGETSSTVALNGRAQFFNVGIKISALGRLPFLNKIARPRWVVEIDDRSLGIDIGRSATSGMKR